MVWLRNEKASMKTDCSTKPYDVATYRNRLGETISMSVTSQGLVEKWESQHENRFVHYFLTIALLSFVGVEWSCAAAGVCG